MHLAPPCWVGKLGITPWDPEVGAFASPPACPSPTSFHPVPSSLTSSAVPTLRPCHHEARFGPSGFPLCRRGAQAFQGEGPPFLRGGPGGRRQSSRLSPGATALEPQAKAGPAPAQKEPTLELGPQAECFEALAPRLGQRLVRLCGATGRRLHPGSRLSGRFPTGLGPPDRAKALTYHQGPHFE